MSEPKTRETGATARLGRTGFPRMTSATGGTLDIVTGATQPGFNPLDLLHASLAACMAMSARIVASRMDLLGQLHGIAVEVRGDKTEEDGRSRIARFDVVFSIDADIDDETKRLIIHEAEKICTVSNTLGATPAIDLRLAD